MTQTSNPSVVHKEALFDRTKLVAGETVVWEDHPATITLFLRPVALAIIALIYAGVLLSYSGGLSLIVAALILSAIMIPFDRRFGLIAAIAGAVVAFIVLFVGPSVELLVIIPVVIGLIPAVSTYLHWRNTVFVVTNRRAISQFGLFNKRLSSISLDHVQQVSVKQPALEKMFGYGDVYISSAAEIGGIRERRAGLRLFAGGVAWENVKGPFQVEKVLNETIYGVKIPAAPAAPQPRPMTSTAESKMVDLKNMKDKGLVTEAEYETKRDEILRQM